MNFNYAYAGSCCNSRLSSVVDQTTGTTLASGMTFNPAGETLTRTLGSGANAVTQTFTYNSRQQLTTITGAIGANSAMNFTYDYGTSSTNTGRVLARTDAIQPEHSVNYTYDSIYRLSNVAAPDQSWSIGWTFDVFGNRLTQTPQGVATSKIGTQTSGYTNNRNNAFSYDAAGNQTNDGSHNYTFNAENQVTQMDGGSAVYTYDGDGRRIKKTFNGETTYTIYGPGGTLCEFSTVAGTGTATAASANDKILYRTSDKLGSAVLLIATNGAVIENNRTLPYGESWQPEVNPVNDKKFTTYQRDQESGLDYAMNRFDSNTNGRFVSVDKGPMVLGIPTTLNRYSYAALDPVNRKDPDGNFAEPWYYQDWAALFYLWGRGVDPSNADPCQMAQVLDPIFGMFSPECGYGPGSPTSYLPEEMGGGGGGGQAGPVWNLLTNDPTDSNVAFIRSRLTEMKGMISQPEFGNCLGFLGGSAFLRGVDSMLAGNKIWVGTSPDQHAQITGMDGEAIDVRIALDGTFFDPSDATPTINANGGFKLAGASFEARMWLLLHEAAHLTTDVTGYDPDDHSMDQQFWNKCGDMVMNASAR